MMAGHVAPEAERGGPIAFVREGDTITIDVAARRIDVAADLAGRARTTALGARPAVGGVLAKYAALVSSASEGAVTRPPLTTSATSPGGS
jgi:dihydroxy-acid dehydratase